MAEIEITVRGSHTVHVAPQRATVYLKVAREGADAASVYAAVERSAAAVREEIVARHDAADGPVVKWTTAQVRAWASRPWNPDGQRLPLVHEAQANLSATFSDFEELSMFLSLVVTREAVEIDHIEWTLTDEQRRELTDEVRVAAVADARAKAEAYATAVGRSTVVPLAIADAGMLGDGGPGGGPVPMYARAAIADAGVEFAPQDVAVTAEVDARFLAP